MLADRAEPGLVDELEEPGRARRAGARIGVEAAFQPGLVEQVAELDAGAGGRELDGGGDAIASASSARIADRRRIHDAPFVLGASEQGACQTDAASADWHLSRASFAQRRAGVVGAALRLGAAQGRGGVDAAADHVRQEIDSDLGGLGEGGEAQQPLLDVRACRPVVGGAPRGRRGQSSRGALDRGQIVAVEGADQRLVRTGQSDREWRGSSAAPGQIEREHALGDAVGSIG